MFNVVKAYLLYRETLQNYTRLNTLTDYEGSIPFARSIPQYQALTINRSRLESVFLTVFPAESRFVLVRTSPSQWPTLSIL
jgi:hypothetical protein